MGGEAGNNGHSNGTALAVVDAPMPSGGATRALDLTNPKDMAALRRALADWPKRFGDIDDATKAGMVATLKAETHGENAVDAIKTLAKLEEMNQKDELRLMDAILGKGKTEINNTQVNNTQVNNTIRLKPIELDDNS